MATDVEKLVVQLSADFKSYENAMAKASGITRKQLAQIKADAANVGSASGQAFTGATAGVKRYGDSASQAAKQSSALRAQTGNLATQFQDIAVQLQGGQSPFTIALQQGTQISAVLGGAGAGGAVKALAGAFASLVSPVSLVTIGLIAAGGAAVQYISGLLDDGAKTEEELKKQSALIQQVAQDWGDAVPAVKAYADAAAQATKAEDLRTAGKAVVADIWKTSKDQVKDYGVQVDDLVQKLVALGADTASIVNLQNAMANLQDKTKDQSATADDAEAVVDALNATMASGVPIAEGLSAGLAGLASSLGVVANQAAAAQSQVNAALDAMQTFRAAEAESITNLDRQKSTGQNYIAEQERLNELSAERLKLEVETNRVKSEIADAGGVVSNEQALKLARERIAAEDRRSKPSQQEQNSKDLQAFRAADTQSMQNFKIADQKSPGWLKEQERLTTLTTQQLNLETEIAKVKGEAKDAGTLITEQQALKIAQSRLAADKLRSDIKKQDAKADRAAGRKPKTDGLERETLSIEKRTAALQAQTKAQTGLNPAIDDYGYAAARAKAQQDLLTAAQQGNITVTDAVKNNINDVAETYAQAVVSSNKLAESQKRIEERAKDVASIQRSFASDVVQGFLDGASAAEVLSNAISNVGQRFLDFALDDLFAKNGPLSSILSGGSAPSSGGGFLNTLMSAFAHHEGGIVGRDGTPRLVNSSVFRGAKRYHTGGLVPGEVPAILKPGELVLTRGQQAAMGGGVSQVHLILDNDLLNARIANVSGPIAVKVVDKRAAGAVARKQARG